MANFLPGTTLGKVIEEPMTAVFNNSVSSLLQMKVHCWGTDSRKSMKLRRNDLWQTGEQGALVSHVNQHK